MTEMETTFSIKESTGYWLRQTYNTMAECLQSRFDKYGVTVAQWTVLSRLYEGSDHTPAKLAEYLNLNRSAITRLLDRLEKKKLVQRIVSAQDKRSVGVSLTKKGREMIPNLIHISRETNNQFLAGLSNNEIAQLDKILRHILANAESSEASSK